MEVKFEDINKIVLNTLDISSDNELVYCVIGDWYFKFLKSEQNKINLQIPNYHPETKLKIYEFIRLFDLTYQLIHKTKQIEFSNTCIFDFFTYKKNIRNLDSKLNLTLEFKIEKSDVLIFGEDTIVPKSSFLPIFLTKQLDELFAVKNELNQIKNKSIYNSFKLFKAIKESELINFPICIDLKSDLTLSITDGELIIENSATRDFILLENYPYKKRGERRTDRLILAVGKYKNLDIKSQILFKYPNNNNIDSRLNNISKGKKIELKLQNRFYYKEIIPEDIILLPSEINEKSTEINSFIKHYEVLDTEHDKELYFLLKDFKEVWDDCPFNIFTISILKYWLMFIHKVVGGVDEWKKKFKEAYPVVTDNIIISKVDKIIEKLYSLNWIDILLEKQQLKHILLPNIIGTQGKIIYQDLVSLENYIKSKRPDITFIQYREDFCYNEYTDLLILEAFKKDELSNINQCTFNTSYSIIVPDFLYYNFKPGIKFYVVNYQSKVLLNEAREKLDEGFEKNKKKIELIKKEIIKEINSEFSIYTNKYEVDEITINIENTDSDEDLNPTNEEENEYENSKVKLDTTYKLIVETEDNQTFELTNRSKILTQRNTMINSIAEALSIGDQFIPTDQINASANKGKLIEKLSKINNSAKFWQVGLFKFKNSKVNIYNYLVTKGLKISESTFNKWYLISDLQKVNEDDLPTNFPLLRENWKIICGELGIDVTNRDQSWIARKGRKEITKLKEIYSNIIKLMYEEDYFGDESNPSLIKEVESILKTNSSIWEKNNGNEPEDSIIVGEEDEIDFEEISKSLIKSIHRAIKLLKVKKITKSINYE